MVFSSLPFLFYFLPITLVVYFISPRKIQNATLAIISLIFYAWGEPVYIVLLLFSALADYVHGLWIEKYRKDAPNKARIGLISSIIVNLAVLFFFKYANFIVDNVNQLLSLQLDPLDLPLPIGISFYTFQTMSYTIDVYRGQVKAQRNLINFTLYVSLFPQLIAGPIVRYALIEQEINDRKWNSHQFAEGVQIFTIGLGKKVLLANSLAVLWNQTEATAAPDLTVMAAWLGIIAFMFHIYFDFSGYSDMAIGLGKMFGFTFPMNFNYPYIARSATEFWRRWHMTLGGWFRDYLYIPLGGNRGGKLKLYRNLFIVWGATGLWHGASWNFILWGLYFGVILALEKAFLLKFLDKIPRFFQHSYLLLVVIFSWVLFAFEELATGLAYAKTMLGLGSLYQTEDLYNLSAFGILFILATFASTPLWKQIDQALQKFKRFLSVREVIRFGAIIGILLLSTAYLVDDSFNPFIYFRF